MKKLSIFVAILTLSLGAQAVKPKPKSGDAPGPLEKSVMSQIEGDTAKQLKLGKVSATCEKAPAKPKDGDTFACTATMKDSKKVHFVAKINVTGKDKLHVSLTTTNLMDHSTIVELIKKTLPEMSSQTSEKLEAKNVDCGQVYVIHDIANMLIPCTITAPSNGHKYKAEINATKQLITVKVEMPEEPKKPEQAPPPAKT